MTELERDCCKTCKHSRRIRSGDNTYSHYWLKCDILVDGEEQIKRPRENCFVYEPKEREQ